MFMCVYILLTIVYVCVLLLIIVYNWWPIMFVLLLCIVYCLFFVGYYSALLFIFVITIGRYGLLLFIIGYHCLWLFITVHCCSLLHMIGLQWVLLVCDLWFLMVRCCLVIAYWVFCFFSHSMQCTCCDQCWDYV